MSVSARRATFAITWLKGWSGSAKNGIFCPDTSVLFKSIPAIPVAISSEGCLRRTGFTDGPPISTSSPSMAGPPSMGSPKALKKRPASCSLTLIVGALPKNTTSALVGIPSVPSNTCKVTSSPAIFTTWASLPFTVANSSYPTPVAFSEHVAFVI